MERLLLTVNEAAEALRISRSQLYKVLATGSLSVVRIGGCTRISVDSLREWIQKQSYGEHSAQSRQEAADLEAKLATLRAELAGIVERHRL